MQSQVSTLGGVYAVTGEYTRRCDHAGTRRGGLIMQGLGEEV